MATIGSAVYVYITDSARAPVPGAELEVRTREEFSVTTDNESEAYVVTGVGSGGTITLVAHAAGAESAPLTVTVRGGIQQVVIGIPAAGELTYRRGDNRLAFPPDPDRYVVLTDGPDVARLASDAFRELGLDAEDITRREGPDVNHSENGFEELTHLVTATPERMTALPSLLEDRGVSVRIARPVRHRAEDPPYGLTGEIVVAFSGDVGREEAARIAAGFGFEVLREVHHAGNAFLFDRGGIPDYDVLEVAEVLDRDERVLWVDVNLIVPLKLDAWTPNDPLFPDVPHLRVINADDAWERLDHEAGLRGGSSAITIGILDPTGVTPNHPDLIGNLTDGTAKLVATVDFRVIPITGQSVANLSGEHGTQCAGSATAVMDNNRGLPGVAPNCHLIGARSLWSTDDVRLADAYLWMAGFLNGSTAAGFPALPVRAADVISSSFGPDPGIDLSPTMRTCFDYLTTFGRGGRGVVVLFPVGNDSYGNFTDRYASQYRPWPTYERCIGVGASINLNPTNPTESHYPDPAGNNTGIATQVDRRALYSPYGATAFRKPDLVSPSHTAYQLMSPSPGYYPPIDPIMSAVRVGIGTVNGCLGPTPCRDYNRTFGGTSHSTPTVAGAVALILSVRPELSWVQVREVLRRSCERIDNTNTDPIGQWQNLDPHIPGIDYSRWYGAGRLDVDRAVELVLNPAATLGDAYVRENLNDVGDVPSPGWHAESPDIWVRRTDDPIPALAWTSAPPHENPVRGRDNYVFCRVRNRGSAPLSAVYLRASITHYPGFEFRYPQEWRPTGNVGRGGIPNPLVPGTYPIGEARIGNLGAGNDTIVKMTWPAALIPPEEVSMGRVMVRWHPCLLLEVAPHDGPAPATGVITVRADNNLAQRNIEIGDPVEIDSWVGAIAGSLDRAGIRSIIIDGRLAEGEIVVLVHVADGDEEIRAALARGAKQAFVPPDETIQWPRLAELNMVFRDRVRLNVGGQGGIDILAAPGTELHLPATGYGPTAAAPEADADTVEGIPVVVVKGLPGILEIPLAVPGGQLFPLAVSARGEWKGELRVTQRRGDGITSSGYTIRHWSGADLAGIAPE